MMLSMFRGPKAPYIQTASDGQQAKKQCRSPGCYAHLCEVLATFNTDLIDFDVLSKDLFDATSNARAKTTTYVSILIVLTRILKR